MTIKSDKWIRKMALEHGMIEPFVDRNVGKGEAVSYGLSSYGYDLRVADEPLLAHRTPARHRDEHAGVDACVVERAAQTRRLDVVADESDERRTRAERGEIAGDVRRAARGIVHALHLHQRNGRFAAQPLDAAVEIYVEKGIAYDRRAQSVERVGQSREIELHFLFPQKRLRRAAQPQSTKRCPINHHARSAL